MRGKLFLYLALVCLLFFSAIFIADGYLGIYDTTYITVGERQQTIEPDYWLKQHSPESTIAYYLSAQRGQKVFFRYEIDNRQFSSYTTSFEASMWHNQEKVQDLLSQTISIDAFDKGTVEWVVDTAELLPTPIPPGKHMSSP